MTNDQLAKMEVHVIRELMRERDAAQARVAELDSAERKNNLDNLIKLLMMARKDKHETASLSYHYESGWTITFNDEWHEDNVTLFVLNEGESVEEFILRVLGEFQTLDDPPTGLSNVTWTWTVH